MRRDIDPGLPIFVRSTPANCDDLAPRIGTYAGWTNYCGSVLHSIRDDAVCTEIPNR